MPKMNFYEKARAINGARVNDTNKDVWLDKLRRDFKKHFMDTTDYQPNALVNDKPQKLIVSKNKSVVTEKKFWTYPGEEVRLGDVVDCYNCKWLITEIDPNDEICVTGKMEQCNREICWQNPHTREIIYSWVTMTRPYYSNLNEGQQITMSKRMYKIQIPYNEETALFDNGKRFMLEVIDGEPKTYRITSVDISTERFQMHGTLQGFIVLQVEQDQYNELVDNAELMICDYISPEEPEVNNPNIKCEITYTGEPELKIGGQPKIFNAIFKNSKNQEIEATSVWEVQMIEEFKDYVEIKEEDNSLSVGILNTGRLLEGTFIKIVLHDKENQNFDEVECKVVALL